ncbi:MULTISPECIES: hypothetical protein [unclassified Bartonella]|uniref:hypothetical protein n=1 Tax=unclassified Bartonella TaxID=2645622 RepID=UPI0035CF3A95
MVQESSKKASYKPSQVPRAIATLGTGKYNDGADLLQEVFCVILSLGELRKMKQMGTLSYNVFFFGFSFL